MSRQNPSAQRKLVPINHHTMISTNGQVAIEFHYDKRAHAQIDTGRDIGEVAVHNGLNRRIKYWGTDNLLPQYRDAMLMSSNIVGELISTKRDLLIGQGLTAYRETFSEDGEKKRTYIPIPDDIKTWMRRSRWNDRYLQKAVLNYWKHSNVFVEFMKAKDGKLLYMKCHDGKFVRAAEKVNGYIPGFYIAADWARAINTKGAVENDLNKAHWIPNIPEDYNDVKDLPDHFMMQIGDEVFHDGYYYHPAYWGGEEWIDLANQIPVFHKKNIKNGYTPRFHIKIPKDYFVDKQKLQMAKNEKDQEECYDAAVRAQKQFVNDFNNFLAGIENAGRSIATTEEFDPILKDWKGIRVEEIKYDMKDEALLKLFEKSNEANIVSHGLPYALAGIDGGGGLKSSGSEIRNLLMYFIISKLPRRRADILRPFELMLEINGWDDMDIHYTFEDILITKLDENASGIKSSVTENTEAYDEP